MIKKILILEDDQFTKECIEVAIGKLNTPHLLKWFPNIDSAINELGDLESIQYNFDLIIADVFLAGEGTGIHFVSKITHENQKKVLVCSGIREEEFKALKSDYDLKCDFIRKPLKISYLIEIFKRILNIVSIESVEGKFEPSNLIEVDFKRNQNNKKNPVILVTGCSSGIGKALAEKLIENNYYRLVLTAREKSLESVREKFKENDNVLILPLDLTDIKQIGESISLVLKKWGSIDVLVNNAGICYRSVTEQMDFESELIQMQTNYLGPMAIIRNVIPVMRENGRGKIINVSSVSGVLGMPTMGSYSASKHALEGASESLWYELKPFGISVTLVRPGFINSDGHTHVCVSNKAKLAEKIKGPYHDFYTFMRPFVGRLMKLSQSTSEGIADQILKIIQTQNPSFTMNVTIDAKILSVIKRVIPTRLFGLLNYWLFSTLSRWGHFSKANPERQSVVARLSLGSQMRRLNRVLKEKARAS